MSFKFGKGPGTKGSKDINFSGQAFTKPERDPLADVEYSGNLQEDSRAELTALQRAYRQRAKAEASRFRAVTDSEYWVALCFTSRGEKESFLAQAGLIHLGDKYIDGRKAARVLGIDIDIDSQTKEQE